MSKSASQIKAIIDLACQLYNKPQNNRADLLQSERLFLEALDYRLEIYGPNSTNVAYLHCYLGLVYGKMDDHFDEGEVHYAAAAQIYKAPLDRATVASNHASLLARKGMLILGEATDIEHDIREDRPARKPRSTPRLIVTRTSLERELAAHAEDLKAKNRELQALRSLARTNNEAAECFRKADDLRLFAYNQVYSLARKSDQEKTQAVNAKKSTVKPVAYLSPAAIMAELDKTAIGQKGAKRGLANAASQHLRRVTMSATDSAQTDGSNVIVVGPTGCGKTLLIASIAQIINVPFYRADATKLTAAGYVGEDTQGLIEGLLRSCNYDIERAQKGIIYIDEIDKIGGGGMGTQRDIGGKAVQEELLTLLEGTKIMVTGKSGKRDDEVEVDTTNILFIVGGAFSKLGDIVAARVKNNGPTIGFGARLNIKQTDNNSFQHMAMAEDFIAFGMIPEFVGRLPKFLFVEKLTVDQLERILVEPKKALVAQKRLLLSATTDLRFTKGALRCIAEEAYKTGYNGRALSGIMEAVLEPIVFDEPRAAIVTREMVLNRHAEITSHNAAVEERPALPDYIIDDEEATAPAAAAVAAVAADSESDESDPGAPTAHPQDNEVAVAVAAKK